MIPWWNTELGEKEQAEMIRAFTERRFTISRSVARVEELFSALLSVPYTILTNSGSSALLMALLSLDLKEDDEVIVPAITWIATAQAPALLKAKVCICDSRSDMPTMDVDHLQTLVTKKTKAIIPVHVNGRCCDLKRIQKLAASVGAYVIEDACKAMFSKNESGYLGTIGEIGCFSLGMISPVSVGYGGLIVTKNIELYTKLKKIRDHGVQRAPEAYEHLGFNFKISDLLASLAIPQLLNIEDKKRKLLAVHDAYFQKIQNPHVTIMPSDKKGGSLPVYVEARSQRREEVVAYLEKHEIQVSRYHLPMYEAAYLNPEGAFPNAKRFAQECFILPSGPGQNLRDIETVIGKINQFQPSLCGV